MTTRRLRPLLLAALALAAAGPGSGCGEILARAGVRSLHEMDAAEAARRISEGSGLLVPASRVGDAPAEEWLAFEGWLLVTDPDPDTALAAGTRLARAGARRVAIVADASGPEGAEPRLTPASPAPASPAPVNPSAGDGIEDRTP